ncbi:MAG: 30S ribosomal protein S20 [Limisphaerales bacterium]
MANQVNITIKKVKDFKPDEKRDWKRDYLSRKMARKTAHNDRVRANLTNLRRSLRKAVETKDSAKASETLKTMYSALDRAAKVGVIHKRAADRRKSRYSAQVKAIAA